MPWQAGAWQCISVIPGMLGDQLLLPDGSASAPALAFTNATGVGLFRTASALVAVPQSNVWEQRNDIAAQTVHVYNTFTDASNYERVAHRWNANVYEIATQAAGTGVVRNIALLGGHVGIGTTEPGAKLDVAGGAIRRSGTIVQGDVILEYTGGGLVGAIKAWGGGGPFIQGLPYVFIGRRPDNLMGARFSTGYSGFSMLTLFPASDQVGLTVAAGGPISATFAGNVGIGTTAPGARLTIRRTTAGNALAVRSTDDASDVFTVNEVGDVTTAAPASSSSAAWRLGTVTTVSPTSPNRTIAVSVGGTTYYLHAKTTND